jgi:hypothetical protein
MNVGFGVTEFPPPLVANLLLQRLAATTVFVCSDRGTVCEDDPVADTILLPRGATDVVVLDLHADEVMRVCLCVCACVCACVRAWTLRAFVVCF